ncbi:hypothetical protein M514_15797 [Trichuris suis]|uniref:Uncharacterized protein n=1 Tax=Trichuris suis TaxID=68888 RepID=A0A085NRJ9_9BILA|nr:hypothetical protein M514_15797 [Trichuris suis]
MLYYTTTKIVCSFPYFAICFVVARRYGAKEQWAFNGTFHFFDDDDDMMSSIAFGCSKGPNFVVAYFSPPKHRTESQIWHPSIDDHNKEKEASVSRRLFCQNVQMRNTWKVKIAKEPKDVQQRINTSSADFILLTKIE